MQTTGTRLLAQIYMSSCVFVIYLITGSGDNFMLLCVRYTMGKKQQISLIAIQFEHKSVSD